MRQFIYAMRFRGSSRRIGVDGNVITSVTIAPGCTIRTLISAEGLRSSLDAEPGLEATFESELVLTGASMFQGAGSIAFGDGGARLSVSTIGSTYLRPASEEVGRHGAAIWKVDGGAGQFEGATGLIASSFIVNERGDVTDHQLGVIETQ